MSKANTTDPGRISGRRNPTDDGAALFALGGYAAVAAAEPDAELIRLCGEFDALEQAGRALENERPVGEAAVEAEEAERDRLSDLKGVLLDRIVVLPCTTTAGIYAIGHSLVGFIGEEELEDDFKPGFDHRLQAALLRGIMRGQRWSAAPASALPAPATAPTPSPDAALIVACAEYVARDKRLLALSKKHANMRSEGPRWNAYIARSRAMAAEHRRQEDEISETVARTPEGIRAKALAAKHALAGGGCETTEPMHDENHLAWSLVEDLLRVT